MPTLSTDESDQTVSQSKTIHNGSVVPLPSHLCGPYWPTTDRRGRIPAYTGSDLCFLTLDRTFSNWDHNRRWNCTLYSSALRSMGEPPTTKSEQTMAQLSLMISWKESWTFSDLLTKSLLPIRQKKTASLNEPTRRSWEPSRLLYLKHELRINGLSKIYL